MSAYLPFSISCLSYPRGVRLRVTQIGIKELRIDARPFWTKEFSGYEMKLDEQNWSSCSNSIAWELRCADGGVRMRQVIWVRGVNSSGHACSASYVVVAT